MRRLGLLVATVALVTAGAVRPGGAQVVEAQPVSGPMAGVATLVFYSDPGCVSGVLLDMTMIADIAPFGPGSLVLHTCDLRPAGGVLESSFTITSADGTATGTVPGYTVTNVAPPGPAPFHFDLTVTGGTGRFAGATGAIALDGSFNSAPAPPVTATASGTVDLVRPEPPPKPGCGTDGRQQDGDVVGRHGRIPPSGRHRRRTTVGARVPRWTSPPGPTSPAASAGS
jgi:hypothetical protein